MTKIVTAYYAQPRTYKTLELRGAQEISIKGDNIALTVENQLTPLSVYPRGASTVSKIIDGAVRLGTVAGAAYVGNTLAEGASRGPTVVNQPDPIIVEPTIVETGGGL
jgi:hypothetical protein